MQSRPLNPYFSDPALDGDTVVFSCNDAIWEVSTDGGRAVRRTPRFTAISTPILDTRRELLVYAASRHGPPQVHVQRDGDEDTRQLTWFVEPCYVRGWARDGRVILTSSAGSVFRQNLSGWLVDPEDGTIERYLLGTLALVSQRVDGACVAIPSGVDPRTWRGYRGGACGEVWIDRYGDGDFRRLRPAEGNISSPRLCLDRVYFVLDEHGTTNLFSCDLEGRDLCQHTQHEGFAVHSLATDGQRIVYCFGGDLFFLDPGKDPLLLEIQVSEPSNSGRTRTATLGADLGDVDGAFGSESLACCAFGSLFEFSVEDQKLIEVHLAGCCSHARYMRDGRLLVVVSGALGDQLLVVGADRDCVDDVELEVDVGRVLTLTVSVSGSMVILCNHRHELIAVNIVSGATKVLDRSHHRPIEQLDVSPDGVFVVYALPVGCYRTILRIVRSDGGGVVAETDPPLSDFSPKFLPDGSIVFLSLQTGAEFGADVFASVNVISLPEEVGWQVAASRRDEGAWTIRRLAAPDISFTEVLMIRGDIVLRLPPVAQTSVDGPNSEQSSPLSRIGDTSHMWVTHSDGVYPCGENGVAVRTGRSWHVARFRRNGEGIRSCKLNLSELLVEVDEAELARAAVHEAWRVAANQVSPRVLESADWDAVGDRYQVLSERVATSRDVVGILNEMFGHLGTSHAFAVPAPPPQSMRQGSLGVRVELDLSAAAWVITHVPIVDARAWRYLGLADPSIGVREGDRLLAIEDERLSSRRCPDSQLVNKAGERVRCELVGSDGQWREVKFKALAGDRPLVYASWIFERERFVFRATHGRLAYIHIPNVSAKTKGAVESWLCCHEGARGLIVDVRYNEGGPYGGEIAEFLARRPLAHVHTRWSYESALPVGSGARSIVVLANRFTCSGGELLAVTLRRLVGCKIIGERTFGGGVGNTVSRGLPGGSSFFLPEIEIASPKDWADVENRGVVPDIEVAQWEELEDPDPLLSRALRELEPEVERRETPE